MHPRRRFTGNKAAPGKIIEPIPVVAAQLREIDRLVAAGRLDAAVDKLLKLEAQEPDSSEILQRLFFSAADSDDWINAVRVGEKLALREPDAPVYCLGLVRLYLSWNYPIHTLHRVKTFLDQWPDDEHAVTLKSLYDALNADFDTNQLMSGFTARVYHDAVYQNEKTQILMAQNDLAEARRVASAMSRKYPTYMPGRNNLAEIEVMLGEFDEAARANRLGLQTEPDNVHALLLALRLGRLRFESANVVAQLAARLKASEQNAERKERKVMEGLIWAGDSQGTLEFFRQVNIRDLDVLDRALVSHYAAVAYSNLGDKGQAKQLWREALRHNPDDKLFKENLDDLKKPVGERHGAVAFPLNRIFPEIVVEDMLRIVQEFDSRDEGGPRDRSEYFKTILEAQPVVATALPAILDLCTPDAIKPMSDLLRSIEARGIQDYAYHFALGQRGSDELRLYILVALSESGYTVDAPVKLWVKGNQTEVSLRGLEITYDVVDPMPPEIDAAATGAYALLSAKKYRQAEVSLRQLVARYPNHPSLWNNLAVSLDKQGKHAEAAQILEQIFQRFPDYLFARTAMAARFAREERIDEANALLEPVKLQGRLHISEFRALAAAHIEILAFDPNSKAHDVELWLNMIESLDPDNPQFDRFKDIHSMKLMEEAMQLGSTSRKMRRRRTRPFTT